MLSHTRGLSAWRLAALLRGRFCLALITGALAFGACVGIAHAASFPTTPALDNFTTDTSLSPATWATPALGEGAAALDPSAHELTGVDASHWDAAIWNTPFSDPVEVWATISRAGANDANLYADVTGGTSGTVHPTSGYFVDFGGSKSNGSLTSVSIWKIDNSVEHELNFVPAPYADLKPGDQIGLSHGATGVLTAWYRPAGGTWSGVTSLQDATYHSGRIAIEFIPGVSYGFSSFGGGGATAPAATTLTKTAVTASAARVSVGRRVTYTASVTPMPSGGTVAFVDGTHPITSCAAQPIIAGKASCTIVYSVAGSHAVSAWYSGSPDGAFAGSKAVPGTTMVAYQSTRTSLSASTGTPALGTAVVYSARVVPAPNSGTVAFRDGGRVLSACRARTVVNGIATCRVVYRSVGTHAIKASFAGTMLYTSSATSITRVTVSLRPTITVAQRAFRVHVACPPHSGGCRILPSATITLRPSKSAFAMTGSTVRLAAGHGNMLTLRLAGKTQTAVATYVRHHPHGTVLVTIRLAIRDGNGSSGSQTLSYSVRGARQLAQL